MSRFLTRENVKLAVVAVACLLVAWTGPSVAHGVHAKFAHNADKVDGKHAVSAGASPSAAKNKLVAHDAQGRLPAKFIPGEFLRGRTFVTTHAGSGWQEHTLTAWLDRYVSSVYANGAAVYPLDATTTVGDASVGLEELDLCYQGHGGGSITGVYVWGTNGGGNYTVLASDATPRGSATATCFAVPVNKAVGEGAAVYVSLSGTVELRGIQATWTPAARIVPSGEPERRAPGDAPVTR